MHFLSSTHQLSDKNSLYSLFNSEIILKISQLKISKLELEWIVYFKHFF